MDTCTVQYSVYELHPSVQHFFLVVLLLAVPKHILFLTVLFFFPRQYYILSAWAEGPLRGMFSSQLNGALWIMPVLFAAPFLAVSIQLPAFSLTPRGRAAWYCCILLYFGGSFNKATMNNSIMVVLGVVLADIYHCEWRRWSTLKFLLFYVACYVAFTIPWFPEPIYSAHVTETIGGAGTVALVVFCPFNRVKSIFDNRCCKYFQGSAFYIYVWHLLIYGVCLIHVEPRVSKPVLYSVGCLSAIVLPILLWWIMDGCVKRCATCVTKKIFVPRDQAIHEKQCRMQNSITRHL